MQIKKQLSRKISLLERRDQGLAEAIKRLEDDIYYRLQEILRDLDRDGGRFLSSDRNLSIIARFSDDVLKGLSSGRLKTGAEEWISTFDSIDELNGQIFDNLTGQITTETIGTLVGPIRTGLVDVLVSQLTDYPSLERSIALPLRQAIMKNIVVGTTYKEAEQTLKAFLGQDPEKLGHISRWSTQLTRDALNQYDGASQKKVADEIGLDSFMFVGSLQDNSRLGCRHMIHAPNPISFRKGPKGKEKIIRQANRFADIVLEDGGFRMEDIPIIISRNKSDGGWNPNTTESSYLSDRNGYNCNHNAIPYLRDDGSQSKAVKDAQLEFL